MTVYLVLICARPRTKPSGCVSNAEHRICVRHLYANFRIDGHPGVLLKDMLWRAASAYT
jgi:hypothetical protein